MFNTIPGRLFSVSNKIRVTATLSLLAGLAFFPPTVLACTCAGYPGDEAQAATIAFARADAIFLGEVTAIKSRRLRPLTVRDMTFDVLFAWKGLGDLSQVVVRSVAGSIGCGYTFRKPGKYVVFAYWDANWKTLTTNMCSLTRKEAQASSLIKELDKLKRMEEESGRESDEAGER